MNKCYECGKDYLVEDLDKSTAKTISCCSKECLSERLERAKSIEHLGQHRIKGLQGKQGVIDVMKICKYALVTNLPSKDEIAVITDEIEGNKSTILKGYYVSYQNGLNADGSFELDNKGLYFAYNFEETITAANNPFKDWSKHSLVEAIEIVCTPTKIIT